MSGHRHGHRGKRTTVAMLYGTTGPARAVYCDPDTDPPGQRWFSVFLSDARPDLEAEPDEAPVCADCLLDNWPELGRGFDLALKTKGGVLRDRATGEWSPTEDGNLYPEDLES